MENQLKESLLKKCIHFTGLMDKTCKAGVVYHDVMQKGCILPCNSSGGSCDKSQFRTPEEAEEIAKEWNDQAESTLKLFAIAQDHYKKTKERHGKVQCVCGKEAGYMVASNGHMWANCPSCGISFRQ